MKKLFSIFCCLLLSASMVTQAQFSLDKNCFTGSTKIGDDGANTVYHYQWYTGGTSRPCTRIVVCFVKSQGVTYGSYFFPPKGNYSVNWQEGSGRIACYQTTNDYSWVYNSSRWYSMWYNSGGTQFKYYSGDFTFDEGEDGIYVTSTNLTLANSGYTQIMASDVSLTLGTAPTYYTVNVNSNNNSYGTVTSNYKSGYVYANNRSQEYKKNSVYTLTATETDGVFVEWQKNGSRISTSNVVDVTIDGNATYTAVFEAASGGTITVNAGSNGQVKLDNGSWGSTFSNTYSGGQSATIAAQANEGYLFYQWTDNASVTNNTNPYNFTVTSTNTYTASFKRAYTITTGVNDEACGSVGITEPYSNGKYYEGQSITLTATPANSFTSFVKWQKNGVDIAGGQNLNVTVNANDTYTAFFSGRNIIEVDIPNATYVDRNATYSLRGNSNGTSSESSGYYVDVQFNASTDALYSVDGIKHNGSNMSFTTKTIEGLEQPCGNRVITHLACYNATGDVYMFNIHWRFPWSGDTNDIFDGGTINTNMEVSYNSTYNAIEVYGYRKTEEWNSQYTYRMVDFLFVTGQRCSDEIKLPVGTYDINCTGEPGTVMSWQSGMGSDFSLCWSQNQGVDLGNKLLDHGTITVSKSGTTYTLVLNAYNSYDRELTATVSFNESIISGTIPNYTLNVTTDGHGTAKVYRYDCSGNENLVSNSGSYKQGSYFKLEASPSSGYAFDYWTIDGVDEHFTNNPEILDGLYDNAVVTAHFVEGSTTHTLDWDVNGGTLVGTAGEDYLAAGEYEEGTTITLPDATREGYTLDYWSFTMGGVPYEESAGAEIDLEEDVTITAQWVANTYNVSFAPNGGSGTMTNQVFTYGVAQNLKTNTFTAPTATATYNYNGATGGNSPASVTVTATADGWTEGNNYYEEGAEVNNLTATNGATVALTAFWGWTEEITLPKPTKTGYEFDQWSFNMGGMDLMEDEGAEIAIEEDVEMTALWNIVTYNLTYEGLNGATNTNPTSYNVESETITLAAPGARDGWTFTGWTMGGSPITEIATGSTGNKTLTANWEEAITTYTVQFHEGEHGRSVTATAGGNSISDGADVQEGSQVVLTAEAKNFYHFREWQDSNNGTQVSTDNPYTVNSLAGNLNLTAVFERDATITLLGDKEAEDDWYDDYAELVDDVKASGDKVTVRYERTMKANTWGVFALPFNYSLRSEGSVLKGKVYKLGEVLYTTNDGMTLNFPPVERNIEANTPYLFYSSSEGKNLEFENVTLQPISNSGDYEVQNSGDIANSSVYFRATTAMTRLDDGKTEAEKKKTIYLSGNRLYYLSLNNASWMRAFRGYFELHTDDLRYIQPRVRIVLGGETATEIDLVDPDNNGKSGVSKYMENGILVIEREGVRYNATGAKIN